LGELNPDSLGPYQPATAGNHGSKPGKTDLRMENSVLDQNVPGIFLNILHATIPYIIGLLQEITSKITDYFTFQPIEIITGKCATKLLNT